MRYKTAHLLITIVSDRVICRKLQVTYRTLSQLIRAKNVPLARIASWLVQLSEFFVRGVDRNQG